MSALFETLFAPPRHTILLIIAAWAGVLLAEKRAALYKLQKDDLNNLLFYSMIAYIIGGRAFFVLRHFANFADSPLGVFSISPDVFDTSGALAAAALTGLAYGQRKKFLYWNTLDALVPFFGMIAIGLGFYHLAAGTAFGLPTSMPWGVEKWSAVRHPTQIYSILASTLTFGLLWFSKPNPRPGIAFLTFAAWTAGWQVFLLGFRADTVYLSNGMRQAQLISLLILATVFWLLERQLSMRKKQK